MAAHLAYAMRKAATSRRKTKAPERRPRQRGPHPEWNLRVWREYHDLTLAELGERAGLTEATMSRLETGNQGYTQRTLGLLARALNCEPAELIMDIRPASKQHQLWLSVARLSEEDAERALRVLSALVDSAA